MLLAVGTAGGLAAAAGAGRLLEAMVPTPAAGDPLVYGTAVAVVVVVRLVAAYVPVRRAIGVEPMHVLRTE